MDGMDAAYGEMNNNTVGAEEEDSNTTASQLNSMGYGSSGAGANNTNEHVSGSGDSTLKSAAILGTAVLFVGLLLFFFIKSILMEFGIMI